MKTTNKNCIIINIIIYLLHANARKLIKEYNFVYIFMYSLHKNISFQTFKNEKQIQNSGCFIYLNFLYTISEIENRNSSFWFYIYFQIFIKRLRFFSFYILHSRKKL